MPVEVTYMHLTPMNFCRIVSYSIQKAIKISNIITIVVITIKELDHIGVSEHTKVSLRTMSNIILLIFHDWAFVEAKNTCGQESLQTDFLVNEINNLFTFEEKNKNHNYYGLCKFLKN